MLSSQGRKGIRHRGQKGTTTLGGESPRAEEEAGDEDRAGIEDGGKDGSGRGEEDSAFLERPKPSMPSNLASPPLLPLLLPSCPVPRRVKEGYKAHDSLGPMLPVDHSVTRSLLEGSSEVISSDALTSITRVNVPSDLPVSDVQIDRIPAEAPSVAACISPGIVTNPVVAEGSILDVFVSVNSFAILHDPEKFDAMELQCGFLSQESARTAPGIISSSEVGPTSLPLQADVDPPCAPDAVGLGADALDADGLPSIDSVVQSSGVTPFKVLDQAQFFKWVRFAPEILSAEDPSSAPRRRMLAPCRDISHPIKFRRSNLDSLASQDVPVDVGPNPGAVIPPSDGVTPETEVAPVIDLNLTPSPIARILKKYSLGASKIEEPSSSSSVGSSVLAKEKSRSRNNFFFWCFGALLFLRRLMLSGIVSQIEHHAVKFLKSPGLYPWASEPLLGAFPRLVTLEGIVFTFCIVDPFYVDLCDCLGEQSCCVYLNWLLGVPPNLTAGVGGLLLLELVAEFLGVACTVYAFDLQ
ncbi:hypothetical protein Nepgr_002642 [Nepenthes gracilis]|uniref:Uncharacterized protein n=1 Tax=Nepenthes gracilis TaxID=150966 RepID=A0AAD3P921_NEPGR|nr:hypothetical protein Nepgr_002642 [Nepenthes gracilis]